MDGRLARNALFSVHNAGPENPVSFAHRYGRSTFTKHSVWTQQRPKWTSNNHHKRPFLWDYDRPKRPKGSENGHGLNYNRKQLSLVEAHRAVRFRQRIQGQSQAVLRKRTSAAHLWDYDRPKRPERRKNGHGLNYICGIVTGQRVPTQFLQCSICGIVIDQTAMASIRYVGL